MGIACRRLGVLAVWALVGMAVPAVTAAQQQDAGEQDCYPACRSGYTCHQGQCVSACNPPCQAGEQCTSAGECVPAGPASGTAPPAGGQTGAPYGGSGGQTGPTAPPGPPGTAPSGAQGGGWVTTTGTVQAPRPARTVDRSLRFGIGAMLGFENSWDVGVSDCDDGGGNDGAPNLGLEGSMRVRLARFASIRVGAFAVFSLGFDSYCTYYTGRYYSDVTFEGSAITFGAEAVFRLGPLGPWFFGAGPSLGAHLVSGSVTGDEIDFSTSGDNFMLGFVTETGFVFGGNENIEVGARFRGGYLTDSEGGRLSGTMFFGYFF